MKKTLLIAAAALAAGVISSQAQVYSANIVGYANVATPTGGNNYLISVPFKIGVSNGANEVFPFPGTPEGSQLLIWTGSDYYNIQIDSGSATGWSLVSDSSPVPVPTLPVGQGFFFQPATGCTNTFVGTIAVNVGTSNVMTLPTGGVNYLVGCAVPYAGAITNGTASGGGPNFSLAAGIPEGSQLLIWTGSDYYNVQLDSGSATGWSLVSDSSPVPVPNITVGQGFFIQPASALEWKTGL